MTDIDDLLTGGAAGKSMKFDQVGKSYSGTVVSSEARQATDLQTGEGKVWKDGSPAMQAVIGIQTDERNPEVENDDGVRYDYVKMWGEQKKAFRAAAQVAGGSPKPGDHYSVTFTGEKASETRGFNATKLYKYEIRKANPVDALIAEPAAPAAAPQYAAPAQVAAPVAAPVAAAAPAPGLNEQQKTQIGMLLGQDLSAAQIASVLSLDESVVQAFQVQQAALAGAGL